MPNTVKELMGQAIAASDGDIGRLEAIFFDDTGWDVRHLVVNTTGGLSGQKVLVPPAAVDRASSPRRALRVALTRDEVMRSLPVDRKFPVSRQYEEASTRYYSRDSSAGELKEAERKAKDSHLRSSDEVIGYSVHGPDGLIGHVDDLLLHDTAWTISALLVGKRRVPCSAVRAIDWKTREVRIASGTRRGS